MDLLATALKAAVKKASSRSRTPWFCSGPIDCLIVVLVVPDDCRQCADSAGAPESPRTPSMRLQATDLRSFRHRSPVFRCGLSGLRADVSAECRADVRFRTRGSRFAHTRGRQDLGPVLRVCGTSHAGLLLTNLTSDIDAVKSFFVSQAIATIIASVFLIVGAGVLLLMINWRLGLCVLAIVPFIAITFQLVLRRVRPLFQKAQEAIDWLNRVINESILGSALIRLLNTQQLEYAKFLAANTEAKDIRLWTWLFAGDPGDYVCRQSGDGDHSPGRRALRDRRHHEPGRFHRV